MPERKTIERARTAKRQGKAPSSQAGEFVREEIHHIREGKHGASSAKQAIAIGLSKARRAGVDLPAPKKGKTSEETREKAKRDLKKGASASKRTSKRTSTTRSKATIGALERKPKRAASAAALSKQASSSARRRTKEERSAAAKKGARTRQRRASRKG